MSITPGPWGVQDRHGEPRYVVRFTNGEDCADGYDGVCQPDNPDDCYLIAAAPAMLEALKRAQDVLADVRSISPHHPVYVQMADAIAQATGGPVAG
jgi:hypothetical protein